MSAVTMAKRLFDITFSIIGLLIFSPLYLIIFLGIKLSCEGPVIFKQERIGKNGKPFYIYKFRTMIVNNELDGIPQLAEPNDQRLTKFGKFLRSHHLDELPQLTSYATLYNGYTDTMEKMLRRLELDLYYMEHQSWELDLSIIFKTFTKIAFGKKI